LKDSNIKFVAVSGFQLYVFTKYYTMFRQVFVGPMIHTDENEKLIAKECIAVFIEDGKVFNIFHIFLPFLFY